MKMYLESDNGGRDILVEVNGKWYSLSSCAPSGYFGTVDIWEHTEEENVAAMIRHAIVNGDCWDINECAIEIERANPIFHYIPEWDGMTANEILDECNAGLDFDLTTLTEI